MLTDLGLIVGPGYPYDIPIGRVYLEKRGGAANATAIQAVPEMLRLLKAAMHALESYAHGNASPDLAREVADACRQVLERVEGERP